MQEFDGLFLVAAWEDFYPFLSTCKPEEKSKLESVILSLTVTDLFEYDILFKEDAILSNQLYFDTNFL